jgi:cold shock CspA family protein
VGIDSIKTFQEGVGIRVNQDDGLELVFAHDRDIDKRGLGKLERNVEY